MGGAVQGACQKCGAAEQCGTLPEVWGRRAVWHTARSVGPRSGVANRQNGCELSEAGRKLGGAKWLALDSPNSQPGVRAAMHCGPRIARAPT
eukprot:364826-Chlamydomonas_euryale.AAC.6